MKRKTHNVLGILLGISVGVGIMAALILTRSKPVKKPPPDIRPLVEVRTLSPQTYVAEVGGFGVVRPLETLEVVVEVGGEVVEVGNGIKAGALVEKDALLYRVDDASLRAGVERLQAQLSAIEARLAEMQVQNRADGKLLEIEESVLNLARKEYARFLKLRKAGTISPSSLEEVELGVKERLLVVEKRRAALSSFTERLSVLKADKRAAQASLKSQNILIRKTSIRAPYRFRLIELSLNLHQVIQPGATVMSGFPLGVPTEISVPVETRHLPALFDLQGTERGTPPWVQVRLNVEVTWDHFGVSYNTSGQLARFGAQVDPNTRTLGARAELVNDDGILRANMFGKATITYRLKDWLISRQIDPIVTGDGNVVLLPSDQLPAGSRIVTTEVPGAFEGMPVRAIEEGGPQK